MKKKDIKKLEKALDHYNKIVELLDDVAISICCDDDIMRNGQTTSYQVAQMHRAAVDEKIYLAGKIHAYKELFIK